MSKKLYAAFVPLLAVVAFVAMPAAAQAAPHWYICKHETAATHEYTDSACSVKLTGKGEYERLRLPFTSAKTRVKTFGVLTLTNATLHSAKCFVDDHGKIWNKALAEPGFDEIQVFENYECTPEPATACTGVLTVTASGLPWASELTEAVAGTPRDKISGIHVTLKCTEPVAEFEFTGTLEPKIINGTQKNGGVSFAEFDATAGTLSNPTVGTATVTGKDYFIGVENAEQVLVLNP
jgi:hypothetical protein